ncbi:MAG: POTRA domain-containing protein, partial [Bryobacteraceae bacterium]
MLARVTAQQTLPAPQTPQQKKQTNPFESVPQSKPEEKKTPQAPKPAFEAPKPAVAPAKPVEAPKPEQLEEVIEAIIFQGARRVPQDTLRALILSRRGDKIDPDTLHRDFMALWNTGRFDDIT